MDAEFNARLKEGINALATLSHLNVHWSLVDQLAETEKNPTQKNAMMQTATLGMDAQKIVSLNQDFTVLPAKTNKRFV